ncbi:argininosuccinate lyase [Pseudomonas aeruginosa]|nr:argininosuccinate lyase [Pseudomonas aeruginosa]
MLGFDAVGGNSLDGVSDRDFAIEFCAAASLAMMHLSRFSEELVLWTSAQFQFIDLPDRFCTGSSIMPQKKNPTCRSWYAASPAGCSAPSPAC